MALPAHDASLILANRKSVFPNSPVCQKVCSVIPLSEKSPARDSFFAGISCSFQMILKPYMEEGWRGISESKRWLHSQG